MEHVVQGESATGEGALYADLAFDKKRVLEIWDQVPHGFMLDAHRSDGRICRKKYTPEYLTLETDSVTAYEYKTTDALNELCRTHPQDWVYIDGRYHFLPAECAYRQVGIRHLVVSSADYTPVRTENLFLMLHVRRFAISKRLRNRLAIAQNLLRKHGALTICSLREKMGLVDVTPILHWISNGDIVTNMSHCRLSEETAAWVALEPAFLESVLKAEARFVPTLERREALAKTRVGSGKTVIVKWQRMAILGFDVPPIPKDIPPLNPKPRTIREWKRTLREHGGDPDCLQPRFEDRGSTDTQLTKPHERLIARAIKIFYRSSAVRGAASTYRQYKRMFGRSKSKNLGKQPVDIKTFKSRIVRRALSSTAEWDRGGRRAANAAAPPTDPQTRDLRASRAWQTAHIDHYLCESYAVVYATRHATYRLKPILTLMMDDYSDNCLAMALNLSAASRRSLACVLRDCVRRHNRLSERCVVDNGPEFRSVYFEQFLASQQITKEEIPTGAPRFHGALERRFGIVESELLGDIPGNSKNDRRGRSASASHRGSRTSKTTLYQLYKAFERYFFEYYNGHPRGVATVSPDQKFEESFARYKCSGFPVQYDLEFLIKTGIPSAAEKHKVDPHRGVRDANGLYYRHPILNLARDGYVYDLVEEPWDPNIRYISVNGEWVVAYNKSVHESRNADSLKSAMTGIAVGEGRAAKKAMKAAADLQLANLVYDLGETIKDGHPEQKRAKPHAHRERRPKQIRPRPRPANPLQLKCRRAA